MTLPKKLPQVKGEGFDANPTLPEIASRLSAQGVSLEVIASALSLPVTELALSLHQTRLIPEDEQLAMGMRELAWKAWAEAMNILESGHPDQKMAIMRITLGRTAGMIGQESSQSHEQIKASLDSLLAGMRDIPTPATPVIPLDIPSNAPKNVINLPQQDAPEDDYIQSGDDFYDR